MRLLHGHGLAQPASDCSSAVLADLHSVYGLPVLETVTSWYERQATAAVATELGSCKAVILQIGVKSAVMCDMCSHVGQPACLRDSSNDC